MINRDRRAENHHFGVKPGKEKGGNQRLSYAQWRTGDRSRYSRAGTSPFGQFLEMKERTIQRAGPASTGAGARVPQIA